MVRKSWTSLLCFSRLSAVSSLLSSTGGPKRKSKQPSLHLCVGSGSLYDCILNSMPLQPGLNTGRGTGGLRRTCATERLCFLLFFCLALYDYLTLKSGILSQPFVPCMNSILNIAWEDRAYLLECTLHAAPAVFGIFYRNCPGIGYRNYLWLF